MLDATEHWQLPEHEIEEYAPKSKRYCICIFVLNEIGRLHAQLQAMQPLTELVDIVIADGGSTDGSIDAAQFRTLGV